MSDAFDQMKKIENDDFNTDSHLPGPEEPEYKYTQREKTNDGIIKNFVLCWGRRIIDFFAWLDVIIAAMAASVLLSMFIDSLNNHPEQSFMLFLCMIFVPLLILLFTIAANYFIYLLIDIRDSLKELTKK